jgi:hypothetical protein
MICLGMTRRVPLPEPVTLIYKATAELEALYPGLVYLPVVGDLRLF